MLLLTLLENFNNNVTVVAKLLNLDPQVFYDQLKSVDPTQKHGNFILKLIKFGNIRWPEDAARVGDALETFTKVKGRLPVNFRDINKFKTLLELEQLVEPLVNQQSKKKGGVADFRSLPGVEVTKVSGGYTIVKVNDAESVKQLGEGTRWCTRGSYRDCMAETYLEEHGCLFILFDGNVPIAQWTPDYSQAMDRDDEPIVNRALAQLIGYEDYVFDKPTEAVAYAHDVIGGRWPEVEPIIAKDPTAALTYTIDVLQRRRWLAAEPFIMQDANRAVDYAQHVIDGRWPEAEPIIKNDPIVAFRYAKFIIRSRWPEAEPIIKNDPIVAFNYAYDIIKGRWPEAEPIIAKNVEAAYYYAYHVVGGRWPEAEPTIMTDYRFAHNYTNNIIRAQYGK